MVCSKAYSKIWKYQWKISQSDCSQKKQFHPVSTLDLVSKRRFLDGKCPSFLIKTDAILFKKKVTSQDQNSPVCEIQNLLGNKSLSISDVSVHLMNNTWLDPKEYRKRGVSNGSSLKNTALFPFSYPPLNHPSTILLIKAPGGFDEIRTKDKYVTLNKDHRFLPSFSVVCNYGEPGVLSCDMSMPLLEVQVSIGQLK